ncbi:NAD(+)/NADH kinase [Chakrabartyella piscis]|uniref:NAD(+)/NADH kinase n=1 Tax=Chakrabartyella piscis TaxID=2918914 RepID=UPI002958B2A2|nr:NAD(+)/NADH kinase [Chakrabartyella piscis]
MKKVGLIPNGEKDKSYTLTKRLLQYLLHKDCVPMIPEDVAEETGYHSYGTTIEELYHETDFIISLGGDGTLLGVGRGVAKFEKPILGINLGTLGFLTAEEKSNAEYAIDCVLEDAYILEKRMMLDASIELDNAKKTGILALNDICISRGAMYKILEYRIYVNDEYVDTLRADGVIICTPTGSTAYNLSAGGPVLKSDAKMIAITPVAAHTLTSRSIVVSADDKIAIEINPKEDIPFTISADGQENYDLEGKVLITIEKSSFQTIIMKTNPQGFYEILRRKLGR